MEATGLLTFDNVIAWIGFWSLVGLLLMGEDKYQAMTAQPWERDARVSEKTLTEVALVGGFLGIVLGAKAFHHKTRKASFWPPIGVAVLVWVIIICYVLPGFPLLWVSIGMPSLR